MAESNDLTILKGRTFTLVLRWETAPIVYKAITAIEQSAPARLTVPGHGCVDGWRAAVTGVKGMTEINAEANKVRSADYQTVTIVDANTIEFNELDASGFKAYVSGGFLQYLTPVDLTGYTGRTKIKDKVGGTLLLSTEPADAPLNLLTATVDTTAKTITLGLDALTSAALSWSKAVHEAEMVAPDGKVYPLILPSKIVVSTEVAT